MARKPPSDRLAPSGKAVEGTKEWEDPIDQEARCMLRLGITVVPAAIRLPWHHSPNRTTAHLSQG